MNIPFKSIVQMFFENATQQGDNCFFIERCDDKSIVTSYEECSLRVWNLANSLKNLNVKSGDKVIIISNNNIYALISDLAVQAIDAVSVPLMPELGFKVLAALIKEIQPKAIILQFSESTMRILYDEKLRKSVQNIILMKPVPDLENVPHKTLKELIEHNSDETFSIDHSATQDCLILYTTIPSGEFKGVVLTHGNIMAVLTDIYKKIPLTSKDIIFTDLPVTYAYGRIVAFYYAIYNSAGIALAHSKRELISDLTTMKPTVMCSVPATYEKLRKILIEHINRLPAFEKVVVKDALRKADYYLRIKDSTHPVFALLQFLYKLNFDFAENVVFPWLRDLLGGKLKILITGAAKCDETLLRFFNSIGLLLIEGYGLTEACGVISANSKKEYLAGSVGKCLNSIDLKILKDGEILVKGPSIMKGYYNDKESTKNIFDENGYLRTGDIGYMNSNGYLFITGRKHDVILLSTGKEINAPLIEEKLTSIDYIKHVCVSGEGKKYPVLLVVPDFEKLKSIAAELNLKDVNIKNLIKEPRIIRVYQSIIEEQLYTLPFDYQIKNFALLENEFTVENGELTLTGKLKRNVIEKKYASIIKKMYEK